MDEMRTNGIEHNIMINGELDSASAPEASIISASELNVKEGDESRSEVKKKVKEEEVSNGVEQDRKMEEEKVEVEMKQQHQSEETASKEGMTTSQGEEWEDILGSGQLLKKVLKRGKGISTRPTPQSRVKVRTRGILENGEVVDKHSGYWFTVGDGDVIQAWDVAITLMEHGEISQVKTVARFAYGELGKPPTIPSNATITYELELLEVLEPIEYGSIPEEELMDIVDKKKTRGNKFFQQKEFEKAINSYQKGLQAIQKYLDEHRISEVPSNLLEIQIRCLNNIAAAQMKVKQYREALEACESVLEKDSENVKALYRAGRVLANLGEMDDAVTRLQKALSLSPGDKTIQNELQRTIKKKEVASQKEKEMYRRMVSGGHAQKKKRPHFTTTWGPLPYVTIAGLTAVIAIGAAFFFTQRH